MSFLINCDLGESIANDAAIMPYLDACSAACGGHTGDEKTMRATILLAKKYHVKVGAHPSFPDPKHFGRQPMEMDPDDLFESLLAQVNNLLIICKEEDYALDHIKAHGALYNLAAKDMDTARVLIKLMKTLPRIPIYAPWNSILAIQAKEENIPVILEGFADRRYTNDLVLVNRSHPNAIINNPQEAVHQVITITKKNEIETIDRLRIPFKAQTFCIHGDNPNAVEIATALNQAKNG